MARDLKNVPEPTAGFGESARCDTARVNPPILQMGKLRQGVRREIIPRGLKNLPNLPNLFQKTTLILCIWSRLVALTRDGGFFFQI